LKLKLQCALCLLQWVYGRGAAAGSGEGDYFEVIRGLLAEAGANATGSENVASVSNKLVDRMESVVGETIAAHYKNLKTACNQNAEKMLDSAREYINREPATRRIRLERACRIACAGNVAPLGTPSEGFSFDEVKEVIHGRLKPVISGDVYGAVKNAARVLYVTDNAGEIGFDSLLISKLKELGCHVTLVVKEPMFFEDATLDDAAFFDLNQQVNAVVTVNGVFVPGEAPPEIADIFKGIDVIIAKGTGNFEALREEVMDKPVIYMLKVKCAPIAVNTGIAAGNFAVIVDAGTTSPN
jgi:uncharacterized protein with ATP-grasp and redox domains